MRDLTHLLGLNYRIDIIIINFLLLFVGPCNFFIWLNVFRIFCIFYWGVYNFSWQSASPWLLVCKPSVYFQNIKISKIVHPFSVWKFSRSVIPWKLRIDLMKSLLGYFSDKLRFQLSHLMLLDWPLGLYSVWPITRNDPLKKPIDEYKWWW